MIQHVEVQIEVLGFHFLIPSVPPGWLCVGRGVLIPPCPHSAVGPHQRRGARRAPRGDTVMEPEMVHDVNSESCWCAPEVLQPCPECHEGAEYIRNLDCWCCSGRGLVPEFDPELPSVIVHNDMDDIIRALTS